MTVVASYGMVLCGNSDDVHHRYRGRIEKVKFGVPINEAFAHDIPATLLVLLLKVNKEGPLKKDIWRAPGNQAQVRKLSHIMQHGRLVNIANFSVYTAASVIKKFLSKLPGGIFGIENEQILFNSSLNSADADKQRQVFYRIFCSLPVPSQHLLVLLFGTFRMVADSADSFGTKMTPDAIAISVAPSLFHTCIHDGRQVKLEDVQRFKLASQVVRQIICSFGHTNLFPRECYEFYARITGRTLRVDENWLFSFQYPSRSFSHPEVVISDCATDGANDPAPIGDAPSCSRQSANLSGRLSHRLSSSVGEALHESSSDVDDILAAEALRPLTACAGDAVRSLSCLDWVHENQTRRMKSRSDWFLSPVLPTKASSKSVDLPACFPGGDWMTMENRPLLLEEEEDVDEPIREEKKGAESATRPTPERPPLGERQNSLKEQQPRSAGTQRKVSGSGSSAVNISGWSVATPPLHNSPSQSTSSAITRRRSWKNRCNRQLLGDIKTHSLDSATLPSGLSHSLANSVEEEKWAAEVASEAVPKKRRSLKKKHSTQF